MKKYGLMLLALLVCGAGYAAQDTALTQREVRDPRQLETWLEGNASDAQTRIAALETGSTVTNAAGNFAVKGDLTVGTNAAVGGVVDATSFTSDAGAGLDTASAGELKIGAATATSVTIGDAGTTVEIVSSDWTIGTDGTIANCAMSADQLTGNIAVARMTNALATGTYDVPVARLTGNIAQARITNALVDAIGPDQMADADHGDVAWSGGVATVDNVAAANIAAGDLAGGVRASATNLNGEIPTASIADGAVTAAKIDPTVVTNVLASGMVLPAVDGNAVTNINAANLTAGTVASAIDGSAITNIPDAGITSLSAAKLTAGTVATAIDGNAITNMAAATAFPGYAVCIVTNLDANGTTNIITFIGTVSYP